MFLVFILSNCFWHGYDTKQFTKLIDIILFPEGIPVQRNHIGFLEKCHTMVTPHCNIRYIAGKVPLESQSLPVQGEISRETQGRNIKILIHVLGLSLPTRFALILLSKVH